MMDVKMSLQMFCAKPGDHASFGHVGDIRNKWGEAVVKVSEGI